MVLFNGIDRKKNRTLRDMYDAYWTAFSYQVRTLRNEAGHVSLETTNRYAEITVRMKEAAMKLCEPTSTGLPVRKPAWRDDAALLTWLAWL